MASVSGRIFSAQAVAPPHALSAQRDVGGDCRRRRDAYQAYLQAQFSLAHTCRCCSFGKLLSQHTKVTSCGSPIQFLSLIPYCQQYRYISMDSSSISDTSLLSLPTTGYIVEVRGCYCGTMPVCVCLVLDPSLPQLRERAIFLVQSLPFTTAGDAP